MRTWRDACLIVSLALSLALPAAARGGDESLGRGLGRRMANFTLKDTTGKPVSLYNFVGKKAVVLVFTGTDCPVGNLYLPRLVELSHKYKEQGVVFLAINSNAHETAEQVAAHASTHGLDFAVLKDPGNLVADMFLAERTCEALVLDGRARLRYRGAIDDQYGQGTRKGEAEHHYLVDALESVLAGREVKVPATAVAGCPIERAEPKPVRGAPGPRVRPAAREIVAALEKSAAHIEVGNVTYAADVAPIVQAKCQGCHRPGQVGPFALLTYDHARRWAASIREVIDERRMPPWHADPRYGHFENDRSLTAQERATLLAWVDQGAPLGNPAQLPPERTFPDGWTIGTPDLVVQLPEEYTVAAQGVLPYEYFRVPTHFTADRWVQAAEARPGDRSVVHHIIVFVDDHQLRSRENRMGAHLVGYAPGDLPSVYPPGVAKRIPAGSDLVFQVHYTPCGQQKRDRSAVGFVFAKELPRHQAVTKGIANPRFVIPPGADNQEVTSSFTFPADAHLLNLMPHMHLRGKDFRYSATYPDGKREILLAVPAYDFGWQSVYRLAEPKAMPAGTRIDCVAHFDNSAQNPANPDATQEVRWGEQTFEEMMIGYIDYYRDAPLDAPGPGAKTAGSGRPRRGSMGALIRVLEALANPQRSAPNTPNGSR